MIVTPTPLDEVKLITPHVFSDERGRFAESWNARMFEALGINAAFVQDNHSVSARGVIRGLHYQRTNPQGKLVRVVVGRAFDVAVDLRRTSMTFGRWAGVILDADTMAMLWIPPGFGHGFLALEDGTALAYKCSAYYDPSDECCVRWNDPRLAIDWPLDGMTPILSERDASAPFLDAAELYL